MKTMTINRSYDLSVYATSVFGSGHFYGAKLLGIYGYDMVKKFDNIDARQKQVYPYLPENTPSDHTKYTYYHFKVKGKDIYLATEWIVPKSIKEGEGETYRITLKNVTPTEVAIVRDQLRVLGLDFEIN